MQSQTLRWIEKNINPEMSVEDIYNYIYNSVNTGNVSVGDIDSDHDYEKQDYPELTSQGHLCRAIYIYRNFCNQVPAEKKKMKVLIADGSSSREYIEFLNEKYDVTVVKNGDKCDLVIFTGGEDVDPKYYNEKVGKYTSYNTHRDEVEREVYRHYQYSTPMWGCCRGNQFLCVMQGGRLIQHVNGHGQSHEIIYNENSYITVTSTHHQMIWPFDLPEDSYNIIGYSKFYRSNTYLNGDNEEKELPNNFVEPEIIKYRNILGIQGHPEYHNATKEFKRITFNLIEELVFNTEKYNKEFNNKMVDLYE